MCGNETETNDVNGSRLAEQGPSSGRCSRQGTIDRHHASPVISNKRKWTSQENKIIMEWITNYSVSPRLEGKESVC